ncbi:MAG: RNA-binding protein [Candidatus Didemnitutus sp.]|nr:RNA-binding protein [Candidatus Didemnitutus sp.]
MDNNKLYVGNLPFTSSAQDLEALFADAGTVGVVEVVFDKFTGRSRGFAFVTMANSEEAQHAVDTLDGFEIDGRKISVSVARPREERPPRGDRGHDRGGGGRGGFGGGGRGGPRRFGGGSGGFRGGDRGGRRDYDERD